jgi:hypothetical protein
LTGYDDSLLLLVVLHVATSPSPVTSQTPESQGGKRTQRRGKKTVKSIIYKRVANTKKTKEIGVHHPYFNGFALNLGSAFFSFFEQSLKGLKLFEASVSFLLGSVQVGS